MKRFVILALILAAAFAVGHRVSAGTSGDDNARMAALVSEMENLGFANVNSLPAVQVQPYTLPGPSVDVMRVRLQETYTVQGVGNDTIDLNGWIAVRHGASRPAFDREPVSWANSITDTEFVALELRGESKVFGPVRVTLDSSRPAIGQVGNIALPENATRTLFAANKRQAKPRAAKPDASAAACRAPVNVKVSMSQLGLEMTTKQPAVWYSEVTTIPPVGQVASVTVEPVSMLSAGREVGTLVSGVVKFREVVRTVPLSHNHQVLVASVTR
jgi:hypothetical protein